MFKRLLIVFILLGLSFNVYSQVKVAILPALDKTGEIKYGLKLMLTASLAEAITNTEGYEAYDRADLSSLLDEQNFQRTGMVSDTEIHKIGEMTGASYVLITEAAFVDDEHLFASAKIVNVESAKIENSTGVMMNVGTPDLLMNDCKSLTNKLLRLSTSEPLKAEKQNEEKQPNLEQQLNQSQIIIQISQSDLQQLGNTANSRPNTHNNHEFVDLGLSVKWATCNVGASRPEDYGDYYMWGETKTSPEYTWATYKYCEGDDEEKQTKYCTKKGWGYKKFVDNKTVLEPSDDAACVNWGGDWRTPTIQEFRELRNKCDWSWCEMNGIMGYKVTSKVSGYEGRFIFLPTGGYYGGSSIGGKGKKGYYWSSTLESDDPENAYGLKFEKDGTNLDWTDNRCDGRTIRPVVQ